MFKKTYLLFLLFLTACQGQNSSELSNNFDSETQMFIIGGKNTPEKDPLQRLVFELRGVSNFHPNGTFTAEYCSVSLLSRKVLLAAAHCVPTNPDYELSLKIYLPKKGLTQVYVDKVVHHPKYIKRNSERNYSYDIALLRLEEEVPEEIADLMQIAKPEDLESMKSIVAAGYGITSEIYEGKADRGYLKNGILDILKYKIKNKTFLVDNSQDTAVCVGDSGSTGFIQDSQGNLKAVGIASHVNYDENENGSGKQLKCNQRAVYINILYFSDWIEKEHQKILSEK